MKKRLMNAAIALFAALPLSSSLLADTNDQSTAANVTESTVSADAVTWCAGGPRFPAYGFNRRGEAQRCADRMARFGRDCRRDTRVQRCFVRNWRDINAVPANACRCAPNFRPIGRWN